MKMMQDYRQRHYFLTQRLKLFSGNVLICILLLNMRLYDKNYNLT